VALLTGGADSRNPGSLVCSDSNLGPLTQHREFLKFTRRLRRGRKSFRPHNYSRELAAYTGGHDNDTTVGWWTSSGVGDSTRTAEEVRQEHAFTRAYLGFENEAINWVFIRAVLASVASIAVVPLQDVLGLGSEARMNLPGTIKGNWTWRYSRGALTQEIRDRLHALTRIYDR